MLASLAQRMWSTCFDAIALGLWMVAVALVQPWPETWPGPLKLLLWFGLPLLAEPVSIRLTGRTAGQALMGLRVLDVGLGRTPLALPRLLGRHLTKLLLLGYSPLYIPFSLRRQALHDALFRTVVVAEPLRSGFRLPEPGPVLLGSYLVSLGVATLAGLFAVFVLTFAFAFTTPSAWAMEIFEGVSMVLASGVFLATVVRRGRIARAQVP